jgi:hypothetical protein
MIYLPPIAELDLIAVYDPGIPNKERILLEAKTQVNLAQYILGIHWQSSSGLATPLNDYVWLGDQVVSPPTRLFIYTGIGTQQFGQFPDGIPYLTIHMGRTSTIFNRLEIVPVLLRIDALNIGKHFDSEKKQLVSAVTISPSANPTLQLPGNAG